LRLRGRRFRSQLSCCRGSQEEAFSYPRLCWPGAAHQFSLDEAASVRATLKSDLAQRARAVALTLSRRAQVQMSLSTLSHAREVLADIQCARESAACARESAAIKPR
jgi:hypothetical protein